MTYYKRACCLILILPRLPLLQLIAPVLSVKRHKNGKPGKSVRRFYRSPPHRRILVRSHQKKIIGALALLLLIYILTYQPPTLHPSYRRIEDVPGYESSGIEEIFKKSDRVNNERNAVDCAEI
jgi:hypothetical protein